MNSDIREESIKIKFNLQEINILFFKEYISYQNILPNKFNFVLFSILLSIPALLLGGWVIYLLPIILLTALCFIFGERFLILLILITLFTLVGELSQSLRAVVHLVDFTLLGFLFLQKFGINFQMYPKVPKSIVYFLILFFSSMTISSLMSSYLFAGIGVIAQQFAFFVIVFVFYSLIETEEVIKIYVISILFVTLILLTISLSLFFKEGYGLVDMITKDRIRISSLISNPEASSNFYIISIPFLIILSLLKNQKSVKYFSLLLIFFLGVGLSLAMSRSAIIGIIISTSIILFLLRRRLFLIFLFTISTIGLSFIFIQPLNQALSLFLRFGEGLTERGPIWSMSLNIIKDHPLFGLGPGAYKYEFYNYFPYMLSDWLGKLLIYYHELSLKVNFSHNFFLVLFTEMGTLGFVTAIMLPIVYFRIGIKTLKKYRNRSKENYYLIVALFAIGVSMIVRNFFNSIGLLYLGGITGNLPFWLIFSSLIYFYTRPVTNASAYN